MKHTFVSYAIIPSLPKAHDGCGKHGSNGNPINVLLIMM